VTVDSFNGKDTIRIDTLDIIKKFLPKAPPKGVRKVYRDEGKIAYYTVRGYWLVRYIEKTSPGLLKNMLAQGQNSKLVVGKIMKALEMEPSIFWSKIDDIVVNYFKVK
jgi:hypothetical protein